MYGMGKIFPGLFVKQSKILTEAVFPVKIFEGALKKSVNNELAYFSRFSISNLINVEAHQQKKRRETIYIIKS